MQPQAQSGIHIGKVAEQTGLSVDAIRFYERSGLLHEPLRTEGGYRLFREADVHDLQFVRRAQELGFSLAEIKELILIRQKHDHACTEVRDLLAAKVKTVRAKIAELESLESELTRSLRNCNRDLGRVKKSASHAECCPVLTRLERGESRGRRHER